MLILLPVDGSDHALAAVRHAIRLVQAGLQARFVLANVQEATHLYEVVLAHDVAVLEAASQAAGEHALVSASALLTAAGVEYLRVVAQGDPGHVLVELAEEQGCDAIILGSEPPGLLGGGRLGAVAQSVLRHANVPVTIVQPEVAEEADDDAAGEGDLDDSAPSV